METRKSELKNDFKKLAGDIEAAGLDLDDIRHLVDNPETIEPEINEIRKAERIIRLNIKSIVNKTDIQQVIH